VVTSSRSSKARIVFPISGDAGRFGLDFAGLYFEAPFKSAADFIDVYENAFADFDVGVETS